MKVKNTILCFILFLFFNIKLYSQELKLGSNNNISWINCKQMVSINLNPGYAVFGGMLVNTILDNAIDISKFIGLNIDKVSTYFSSIFANTTYWYIPAASYSLFIHDRIAVESGLGLYASMFDLIVSKDNALKLLNDLGKYEANSIIASDTAFRSSFLYMPFIVGFKFYAENKQLYNSFKLGLDSIFYTYDTLNGITGIKTSQTIHDVSVYVSYELGWNIELFTTKNWYVKPTLDISILEIGYYIRPWHKTAYNTMVNTLSLLTSGLLDDTPIPYWDKLPYWIKTYSRIRFALFPRIGFSFKF